jgi:septum formation protein
VEVARENARRKAQAVGGERVLAVDTVVALDGRIYGKPRDEDEARATLLALEGRTHEVISGVSWQGRVEHATTRVTMRTGLVDWYVPHCEWQDRAGGYAIQGKGAALVSGIEGDYLNVVGLPLAALLDLAPDLLEPAR